MWIKSFAAAAALAAGSLLSSQAHADSVTADWLNIDPKLNVGIVVNNFHGFSFSGTVQTGVNNWNVTASTSSLFEVNQPIDAFCIEVRQYLADPTTFTVGSLDNAPDPDYPAGGVLGMGTPKADLIRELWGEYFDDIHVGTTTEKNTKAAAFQLAVWNIVYDSDYTVSGGAALGGTFYATNSDAAKAQADAWLAGIRDNSFQKASLVALTNPNAQDMVTAISPEIVTSSVPTPVAAGLGLGCFGMLFMQRRRSGALV